MENQIEIYTTKENQIEVQVLFEQDTVWLSQEQLVRLFNSCLLYTSDAADE